MAQMGRWLSNSSSTEGRRLRDIVAALKEWGEFYQESSDRTVRCSNKAKEAGRTAVTLMLADLALLNECGASYGCRHDREMAFTCLGDAATWPGERDLGDCPAWGEYFTKPKMWDGQRRSFIDEVSRWANRVDEEQIWSRHRLNGQRQRPDIPALIERLKALWAALDSGDQDFVSRATNDVKAYVGSAEQLYALLRDPLRGLSQLNWFYEIQSHRQGGGLHPSHFHA